MEAKESFVVNIVRCESLLGIHTRLWPRRPAAQGDDLLRSAIVLSVSSMDSYFHDVILEFAPRLMLAFSKRQCGAPGKLLERLKGEFTPVKSLELLGRSRPDEGLRKMVSDLIGNHTFQNPGEIESGLKLLGVDDLWEPLRKRLRVKTKKQAREYVQPYVTRRHRIVHEADTYKSKKYHDTLRPVQKRYVHECVRRINRFVRAIDKVVQAVMRRRLRQGG